MNKKVSKEKSRQENLNLSLPEDRIQKTYSDFSKGELISELKTRKAELNLYKKHLQKERELLDQIKLVVSDTIDQPENKYFESLAVNISSIFKTKYVAICKVVGTLKDKATTLAFCKNGRKIKGLTYDLVNTPCAEVVRSGEQLHVKNVLTLFPQDHYLERAGVESYYGKTICNRKGHVLGILVLMHDEPWDPVPNFTPILKIINARIGLEMERYGFVEELNSKMRQLKKKDLLLSDLLGQIEIEKKFISESVTINISKLIKPILHKMSRDPSKINSEMLNLLESNIAQLVSDFGRKISNELLNLTPRETEICNLIKEGMTNKEIATYLSLHYNTIESHRRNIRKKLNILNKDVNLSTYLNNL